jgi:hypothetical protein
VLLVLVLLLLGSKLDQHPLTLGMYVLGSDLDHNRRRSRSSRGVSVRYLSYYSLTLLLIRISRSASSDPRYPQIGSDGFKKMRIVSE